ncbi:DNA polymerase III subunit delta' [Colwellia sp. MB02u-18]|uniref:DNA polymerase III subunit delta' n=1 Tax=unclassified Colwellia TaxID=196834 RepID=UPI0015F56474|nr:MULTISPECIES: DNA polymerase III subunit delta' [unclassified Colwellia]MBA6224978.1 DNA polymerase III subunit delta' [Colwellia sp. MB3u-45]MBA6268734.1 DNA polymerase III subunit delta' [Colwellia sp. MB3u-43]MBA6321165.1 DNA polymerase III subunit delta' [Colwellia sp. MB02u-19]MBA6325718.1 DNA polymerase III subunit delta' [Colwellia sp. MB02u-18]MBA6332193.1 DNA polymerase III subunit delta' [Colwellia sp. MB02u-12]
MKTWLLALQQQLSRQIHENKLPHALLFSGVDGAGQEEIAHWLINVLLCQDLTQDLPQNRKQETEENLRKVSQVSEETTNAQPFIFQPCGYCKTCKLFANGSYPDHLTIVNDKNTIGVDAIRKLSQFFEKTAHIGIAKTALVNHADTMTVSAANALLKTLEEPTSQSFIMLTTHSSDVLLPTIISRCQKFEIRPPVGKKLLAEYKKQGNDAFVNLSHLSELTDEATAVAFTAFRDKVKDYLCAHQHRAEILTLLVERHDGFRWLEKILVNLMRNQWGWPTAGHENQQASVINKQQLWQVYNLVQAANIKLKTLVQVNRQFLSEKLLADISLVVEQKKQ